jgi:hypothetical protein
MGREIRGICRAMKPQGRVSNPPLFAAAPCTPALPDDCWAAGDGQQMAPCGRKSFFPRLPAPHRRVLEIAPVAALLA